MRFSLHRCTGFQGFSRAAFLSAALSLFLLVAPNASPQAHYLGESYLFLNIQDGVMKGHVDIPLAELGDVLFAGEVTDGILTPEEVETNIEQLKSYLSQRVALGAGDTWFPIRFETHEIMTTPEVPFVKLNYTIDGVSEIPTVLKVRYSVLFDRDPRHRALMVIESNEATGTVNPGEQASLVFNKDKQVQELDLTEASRLDMFFAYMEHGIFHIAIGIDHILFLVAFLLTSVLQRENGRWVACRSFRGAFLNVVTIVTLFTIAHSITLALAALEIVTLPTRFVESMIALTVIFAAVHNLYPLMDKRVALLVFVFGLFHGFGFANVLADLGFKDLSLVATLLGFNLGVEVGQLIVVAAIFPVLFLIRAHRYYSAAGLGLGSSAIALLGIIWFTERALGLSL